MTTTGDDDVAGQRAASVVYVGEVREWNGDTWQHVVTDPDRDFVRYCLMYRGYSGRSQRITAKADSLPPDLP